MKRHLLRLVTDDSAEDLIEYALLSGFIGSAGVLVFPEIVEKMSAAYSGWVSAAQAVSEPCPPAAVGPCS